MSSWLRHQSRRIQSERSVKAARNGDCSTTAEADWVSLATAKADWVSSATAEAEQVSSQTAEAEPGNEDIA